MAFNKMFGLYPWADWQLRAHDLMGKKQNEPAENLLFNFNTNRLMKCHSMKN